MKLHNTTLLCLLLWIHQYASASQAFSLPTVITTTTRASRTRRVSPSSHHHHRRKNGSNLEERLLTLRGGDDNANAETTTTTTTTTKAGTLSGLSTLLLSGAQSYSKSLETNPILTKSITACFIFAASDMLAQTIEGNNKKDKKRTIAASLVGLLYFGPAAHYWYDNIFLLFPGTSLFSILQKAAMGQLFFGPSFTCIFFASTLLQAGNFSLPNWWRKIRSDLAGAWLAGAGYWPLVDLISYSLVPQRWIPLFVNICSLIWNIYLSIVANRSRTKGAVA